MCCLKMFIDFGQPEAPPAVLAESDSLFSDGAIDSIRQDPGQPCFVTPTPFPHNLPPW